jgi:hypothetical protein
VYGVPKDRGSSELTPDTVHRIAQELRFLRGLLEAEKKWALVQTTGETQRQLLLRIYFWRGVLNTAEKRLSR